MKEKKKETPNNHYILLLPGPKVPVISVARIRFVSQSYNLKSWKSYNF